jgi:hypothetical protein
MRAHNRNHDKPVLSIPWPRPPRPETEMRREAEQAMRAFAERQPPQDQAPPPTSEEPPPWE